jgi:hypothetical protein
VQVNPIQIHFDLCSCLWLSSFALNLHHSLLSSSPDRQQAAAALMYMDVKLEAIMPRVCYNYVLCIEDLWVAGSIQVACTQQADCLI